MSNDIILRQEIRYSLGFVRSLIDNYSGLYSAENLTRDVLQFCDVMTSSDAADQRLNEARRVVEERCERLAQATSRFSDRDPAVIAALRAQAGASVDLLQDAVFEWHKARTPVPAIGRLLRRKSL
jgi:L-alanine-DL-glutamate epimerase-like enolase superfamily enzyme